MVVVVYVYILRCSDGSYFIGHTAISPRASGRTPKGTERASPVEHGEEEL